MLVERLPKLANEGGLAVIITTALTYASTVNINFNTTTEYKLDLTGDVTFTTSNKGDGKEVILKIKADSSQRNLTFPAWNFIGAAAPTSIAASKTGILSLRCYSALEADVQAVWSVQP